MSILSHDLQCTLLFPGTFPDLLRSLGGVSALMASLYLGVIFFPVDVIPKPRIFNSWTANLHFLRPTLKSCSCGSHHDFLQKVEMFLLIIPGQIDIIDMQFAQEGLLGSLRVGVGIHLENSLIP